MNGEDPSRHDLVSRRMKQALLVFAVIAGFFVVAEHRAHVIPYLPWLLLAACPLMHMFMHRGHGGHHHGSDPGESTEGKNEPPKHGSASATGSGSARLPGMSHASEGDGS